MGTGTVPGAIPAPVFHPAAHTSLQLLQQLARDGYREDGLQLIRDALAQASRLFACRFQYSGEPFMVHVVGTASYLASLRVAPELVAAGLIHNVYGNGDFGDARGGAEEWKRQEVRRVLGAEVEKYVYEFWRSLRWSRETVSQMSLDIEALDATQRAVLLLRLADLAEHHRDLGQAFRGRQRRQRAVLESMGSTWLLLARALAGPAFADELSRLFETTLSTELPDEICGLTGRKGSFPVLPRSYRPRLSVVVRQASSQLRRFQNRVLARLGRRPAGPAVQA